MDDEEKGKSEMQPINAAEGYVVQEGKKLTQYIAALAVTLGAFTAGTILSWSSPALPMLQNATTTPFQEPITNEEGMWIGSLLAIGALVGAFPTGYLADKFGRKIILIGLAVPFILSWLMIIFAGNVVALYVGRVLAGIATGGICVAAPLYIGEIAENSVRGALGSYFQLLLTVGILFSYVAGALVDYFWLGILSGIVPVVFLAVFFFMPETPSYLISKNKRAEAEKSLSWLRGDSHNVKYELAKMEEEVKEAQNNKGTFKDLISSKANINGLIISLGLMIFQQLSGINAVIFYTAQIFSVAGSNLDPSVCAIIVGVFQVIVTYAATLLVDRAGRKILLLISSGVMCTCLFVLGFSEKVKSFPLGFPLWDTAYSFALFPGAYFYMKDADEESVKSIGWIPLLSVSLFVVCFSLGFGPLPWMMMGELFSSSIKGLASGSAVTLNWLLVFIVTKTFQDLIFALGTAGTFWLFGSITALGFVFVCLLVKETKGKSFGEIQKMLGG